MKYFITALSCSMIFLFSFAQSQNMTDAEGRKQGFWHLNMPAKYGEPGYQESGIFQNNQKEGRWILMNTMGDTLGIEHYKHGLKDGHCIYFSLAGLIREESWAVLEPHHQYDTIKVYGQSEADGIKKKQVQNESISVKNGTWKYWDPEKVVLLKQEEYQMGQLISDDGTAKSDTSLPPDPSAKTSTATPTKSKTVKKPKEVLQYEKDNSDKKKIKVRTGATSY